jgi:hypothetical protein
MKTYRVQYRIDGGRLFLFDVVKARTPAGAIAQAARHLTDVEGVLDIIATPEA